MTLIGVDIRRSLYFCFQKLLLDTVTTQAGCVEHQPPEKL